MTILDQVLDTVMQLPLEQQKILIQILHNRYVEAHREEIAKDAQEAIVAFHKGKLKSQPVEEILTELSQSLDETNEP